jgi:flagellar biosynthetic protein FliP
MSFIGVLAALAVTIGTLLVALRVLRRFHNPGAGGGRRVELEVLQRVSTGPRQGVALLRVADRVLVVAVAEGGTTLLTELSGEALERALEPASASTALFAVNKGRWLRLGWIGLVVLSLLSPGAVQAQTAPPTTAVSGTGQHPAVDAPRPPQVTLDLSNGDNELQLSGAVGIVAFLGAMTLLPALLLLMTSFTRILVSLHFVRSALGTQTTPPGQLLVAIAVLLTAVAMAPVLDDANRTAVAPYFRGEISQVEAYKLGILPFRGFMLANTREQDLAMFAELSRVEQVESVEELPTAVVVSAFVTSELRTAFQIGFVIYVPFVVVDLIVASVLMSMGMFMLPPVMVSLPFKLLLFVLADGWSLVAQNLVAGFRV